MSLKLVGVYAVYPWQDIPFFTDVRGETYSIALADFPQSIVVSEPTVVDLYRELAAFSPPFFPALKTHRLDKHTWRWRRASAVIYWRADDARVEPRLALLWLASRLLDFIFTCATGLAPVGGSR